MSIDEVLRVCALCVVLAGAETLHGIARTTLITPRFGKERAIKLSVITGSLLALAICFALVPGIGLQSPQSHLLLGIVLAVFMASFDIAIGKWLMHKSWAKIRPDFNPATGNFLLYGLLAMCFMPLLVWYAGRT